MTEAFGSRRLTDSLLGPVTTDDRAAFLAAAARLPAVLSGLAVTRPGGGPFRLTDHDVRTALFPSGRVGTEVPFAWSARTARRALGLAAVRSLVAGEVRSPADGSRLAIARAVKSDHQGNQPHSTMDRWLAKLPATARAAVHAEAATWATRLWCALDWNALGEQPTIGRDHWWDSPHSSLLALRSRAEVRTVCAGSGSDAFSVHLVVLGGPRRSTIRSELSVVALVEALVAPQSRPPGRIVGWWPDSGHLVTVEVDQAALEAGIAAVARTLVRVEEPRSPFGSATRAAA